MSIDWNLLCSLCFVSAAGYLIGFAIGYYFRWGRDE